MSTASLRRDHDLIEKVARSMTATIQMLRQGRSIPEPILAQVLDFTKNFTDVCHHSKEEDALFPALQKAGMPAHMGPIAVMLMEHKKSREIAKRMESSSRAYLDSGEPAGLIADMQEYVDHITEHLWKENNRLFMMAESRLQHAAREVSSQLDEVESSKLSGMGTDRSHYERIAANLSEHAAGQYCSTDWEDT